jgi:hypothetical protein
VVSNLATPALSDDKTSVLIKKSKTEADVQGSSVHLFRTLADATQSSEGYIIGDKEYKIVDKTPQEMMGQIALGWSFWHLEATFPYSANAAIATKTGTDTFEGRPVNVFTVDTSKIDPAVLESYQTMGMFPINSSKGTIWIDQQTGALVMANIDYELQVKNLDSDKLVGTGNGHVDISISKIGQVTVKAP